MATNLEIYQLRESTNIRQRTGVAVAKAAVYVIGLPLGDGTGGTATANTKTFAREAMRRLAIDLNSAINDFIWYVVTNGDVQQDGEAVADATIEFVVNTYWPQLWA